MTNWLAGALELPPHGRVGPGVENPAESQHAVKYHPAAEFVWAHCARVDVGFGHPPGQRGAPGASACVRARDMIDRRALPHSFGKGCSINERLGRALP